MSKHPSLASRIRTFDSRAWRSVDVAKVLGCSDSYVRAVRQRLSQQRREQDRAYFRAVYRTSDKAKMTAASRKAYRAARDAGASPSAAQRAGEQARKAVCYRTYNRVAAAQAWRDAKS
jgi:hypothetical protein